MSLTLCFLSPIRERRDILIDRALFLDSWLDKYTSPSYRLFLPHSLGLLLRASAGACHGDKVITLWQQPVLQTYIRPSLDSSSLISKQQIFDTSHTISHRLPRWLEPMATNSRIQSPYVAVFTAFELFGLCGTVLMLLTAMIARGAPRHSTWFSVVFSFLILTTSYCLLLMSGNIKNPNPPFSLCASQAALVDAAPPLAAGTTLGLVTQIYYNISNLSNEPGTSRRRRFWSLLFVVLPYLFYFPMAIGSLLAGLSRPDAVQRRVDSAYCSFNDNLRAPSRIGSITTAVLMLPVIALQAATWVKLRRMWRVVREQVVPLGTAVRVLTFTLFGALCIGLGVVVALVPGWNPDFDIMLATVPVALVLIFGTQSDLCIYWAFWKWRWKDGSFHRRDLEINSISRTRLIVLRRHTRPVVPSCEQGIQIEPM
ncbi:hypothetical protein DFP72DRAFT_286770 [Ephemerocybe angulata]|uniref:Uncharacterized protein n=1 Tax=Ephemerocybe angulata TaxID=980116 RepID=A0A8H6M837_9AGAR|nr:hypothetical protein DFP72DRAFT_286770 [Tulosesus angulatus]